MKYAAVIKRGNELYDLALRLKRELAGSERHLLRKKQNCSRAGKILTYLCEHENCTKREAQEILQELAALGVLTKITRNKGKGAIGDGTLYRFPSNDDKYTQFLEILLEDSREQSAIESRQVRNLEFKQNLLVQTAVVSVLINFFFVLIILEVSLVVHFFFFACLLVTGYYMFYFNPHQPFQHLRQKKETSSEADSPSNFDKNLHILVERMKNDSVSDDELTFQLQKLSECIGDQGFFLTPPFAHAMVGTFNHSKEIASRICSQNIKLLTYTGWSRDQISALNLEHVLKLGFAQLLPVQASDNSYILYFQSSRCNLYTHSSDLWFQIVYYMFLKTSERPNVSVNMISMVTDFSGIPLSQFRKVSSRDVEIAKRFTDAPATKFKFLYFVNVPVWLKLIKMCIPSKYTSRCRFVNKTQLCEWLGREALPVEVGGVLEQQDWSRQVDDWIQTEKDQNEKRTSISV